ncbi:MAG: hypothetical protein AB2A00_29010 [Myxococcota bacterium]
MRFSGVAVCLVLVPWLAVTAGACAGGKSTSRRAATSERLSSLYFPLKVGDRWVYEDAFLGRKQTYQVAIAREEAPGRYVAQMLPMVSDGKRYKPLEARFEVRPRGIFDGTRYLLEEPMEVGHKWMAIHDVKTAERFELISLDAQADVPAGRFTGCAQTRSTIKLPHDESKVTDVTFCKGVGMVERVAWVHTPGKKSIEQWHLRLLSYESGGKRVYPKHLGD